MISLRLYMYFLLVYRMLASRFKSLCPERIKAASQIKGYICKMIQGIKRLPKQEMPLYTVGVQVLHVWVGMRTKADAESFLFVLVGPPKNEGLVFGYTASCGSSQPIGFGHGAGLRA